MALQQATTHEPTLSNTMFIYFTDPVPPMQIINRDYVLSFRLRSIIHPEKLDLSKPLNLAEAWLYEYNIALYGKIQNHTKQGKTEALRQLYQFIHTTDALMRTGNFLTDEVKNPKVCIIDDTALGWLYEVNTITDVELPDIETICDIFHKANIRADHTLPHSI